MGLDLNQKNESTWGCDFSQKPIPSCCPKVRQQLLSIKIDFLFYSEFWCSYDDFLKGVSILNYIPFCTLFLKLSKCTVDPPKL